MIYGTYLGERKQKSKRGPYLVVESSLASSLSQCPFGHCPYASTGILASSVFAVNYAINN